MPGDAEPDVSLALTPPEEQLLALIREGRFDAEIAVRLGITNRDVKERVERLVAKLGARDRAELRDGPRPDAPVSEPEERPFAEGLVLSRPPRGTLYPALFALAFAAVAVFIVLAFLWPSDDAPAATPVVVDAAASAPPSPTVATVRIAGRDMIELGPLLAASPDGRVVRFEASEDLLVVETTGGGGVSLADWQTNYVSLTQFGLSSTLSGQTIRLRFQALPPAVFNLHADSAGNRLFAPTETDGANPEFVLSAVTGPDAAGLHLELDSAGVLYAAPAPTSEDRVVVFATGESLDVSQTKALGKAPLAPPFHGVNECNVNAARCQAFVYADGPPPNPVTFLVPVDGTLTCRDDGVLQLEAASFRLFFQQVDRTGKDLFGCYPPSSAASDPKGRAREVHTGEVLSQSTHYRITAETPGGVVPNSPPGGRPLSVVVAGDRTIYVGVITPRFGCPCRTGN